MNRQNSQLDPHKYNPLWNLSRIMKYIGWGVMILGAGAAVLSFASMMQTLSAFGSSFGSFGNINTTLLLPVLISSVVMFCGAAIVGVTYLAFGELIKAFIDIAFCSLYTAQKVTWLEG